MSDTKVEYRSTGISFFGLLTILFIGLKLAGYIEWSWLWVLAPMWVPAAAFFGVFVLIVICLVVAELIAKVFSK